MNDPDRHAAAPVPAVPAPPASPAPPAPPAPVEPVSPWSGSFDLALTGSEGNTDTQNFRTSVDAKHEDEDSVDSFSFWYRRNTTDNDATEAKTFAQYRHEWKLQDSKWGSFVQATRETDRFADFDSRVGVAGGAAYRFSEGPVHAVKGRLGAGVSRKYGVDDPDVDETSYEALLGLDWHWKISEVSDFNLTTDLYPGINPSGEHRSVSKAALTTKPDPDSAWFLKLGVDHFHDTQPGDGKKPNDWNYYVGFGRFF